jgi:hypothetical protein
MAIIKSIAGLLSPALENEIIKRVRRNHGLEHATINLLNRQHYILSGQASTGGFIVIGEVPTDKLETAAHEALNRMRGGQAHLAIHPHCGTNLVTSGLLTTAIAALGFMGTNRKRAWERFPVVMLFMMFAAFYSQPIGMVVQEHITTSGELGELEIITIKRGEMKIPFRGKPVLVHHVVTR